MYHVLYLNEVNYMNIPVKGGLICHVLYFNEVNLYIAGIEERGGGFLFH